MERLWIFSLALAGVLALLYGAILVAMLAILGRIQLKISPAARVLVTEDGPEIHTVMPEVSGVDSDGRAVSSSDLRGGDYVLLFLSSGCDPCDQLLRALRAMERDLSRPVRFLAVLEAPRAGAKRYLRRYGVRFPVLIDEHETVRKRLGIKRTPYGFFVDSDGVVRMKGVVNNREQLEGLIQRKGRNFGGLVWDPVTTAQPHISSA